VKAETVTDPNAVTPATGGQTVKVFDAQVAQPKPDEAPKQAVDVTQAVKDKKTKTPASQTGTETNAGATGSTTTTTPATGTNTPAGTTGAGAAAGANNAAGTTTPGGKAGAKGGPNATCAPKDMVNGVCPPEKGKPKPTGGNAAPSGAAAGANTTTGTTTTEGTGTTTNTGGKGGAKGGANATCAPKDMVNGVCPPEKGKPKSTSGNAAPAATDTGTSTGKGKGGADQTNGAAAGGATNATSGKAPKCAPDEVLVKGVCQPAETPKTQGKSGGGATQPADNGQPAASGAKSSNEVAPADNGPAKGKGKGPAKCAPNEELIQGVCTPKGGASGANSDTAPAQ